MRYNKEVFIYKLKKTVTFKVPYIGFNLIGDFYSLKENGEIVIFENYQWNGATPKYSLLGAVIGTPEGAICRNGYPATYYATLLHDVLYQISESHNVGDRKPADKLFYKMLKEDGFKLARLYYIAVRLFGSGSWGKK